MSGIAGIKSDRNKEKGISDYGSSILEILEKTLTGTSEPTKGGKFHASALGNPCDRYLWLSYTGRLPPSVISSDLRRIFDHGNITQDRYREYFKSANLYISEEISSKLGFPPISGRADFMIRIRDEPYIIEFKTINSRNFDELSAPVKEHAIQLQIYLNMLNIRRGSVLYECKDNQKLKIYDLEKSDTIFSQIVERCKKIMDMPMMPKLKDVLAFHKPQCQCLAVKDG